VSKTAPLTPWSRTAAAALPSVRPSSVHRGGEHLVEERLEVGLGGELTVDRVLDARRRASRHGGANSFQELGLEGDADLRGLECVRNVSARVCE
jgi:hypothetical protein